MNDVYDGYEWSDVYDGSDGCMMDLMGMMGVCWV